MFACVLLVVILHIVVYVVVGGFMGYSERLGSYFVQGIV